MANLLKDPCNQALVYTSAAGMVSNQKSTKAGTGSDALLADFYVSLCYCCAPQSAIYGNLFQRYILAV
jgi:hypothetical protein